MAAMTMLNKALMRVLPLENIPTPHQECSLQVCKNLKEKICLCLKIIDLHRSFPIQKQLR